MQLKPHQAEAVEKIRNGSVLAGGVGVGKTHTAIAYFVLRVCMGVLDRSQPMGMPKKLIVITTAKKRDTLDWQKTALSFGIFNEPELSYGGQGIVVDSYNNIEKYLDVEDAFFIFDEQKLVGSGVWVKAFLKITKNNEWILLSATPADNWIDYVPIFIANGFFRNRTEFVNNHVVWTFHGKFRKIRGYYGVRHLRAYRDAVLVEMPYERHTKRHLEVVDVDYDVEKFDKVWKKLWNVFDDVPLIDVAEKHRVGRKVVNSDGSRVDKLLELWEKHPKIIVFYNFDYELEALREVADLWNDSQTSGGPHTEPGNTSASVNSPLMLIPGSLDAVVAEWNGHKHQPVPETDRWIYLVQYMAGSEGWNCTTTDAVVFYSLTYSHKQFEQAQGRIDRLDTPFIDLFYYIFLSKAKIDQVIWRAIGDKKSFHEGRNVKFAA